MNIKNEIKEFRKKVIYDFDGYEDYHIKYKNLGINQTHETIVNLVEPNSKTLELGCDTGDLSHWLIKEKKCDCHGIDISISAIKIARNRGINAKVADITSDSFNIKEKYDYILFPDVLEHLTNPEKIMKKIDGKFKYLIISVPNYGRFNHRLRFLFGRQPIDIPRMHVSMWTKNDMEEWLNMHNLKFEFILLKKSSFIVRLAPNLFASKLIYLCESKNPNHGVSVK